MRVLKYYVENKAQLETWNKVKENKYYITAFWCETIKSNKQCFPLCQTYKTYYHFKLDLKKVDQHTPRGKWLIHGTKRRKDNQLQSLELPCRVSL